MKVKFGKETLKWAKELIQESEIVNKDSEVQEPSSDFSLAIAKLVLQENEKNEIKTNT